MNKTLIACSLLMLTMTACRTAVNTVENEDTIGVSNIIEDRRVITDGTLKRRVDVTAINERKAPNGFKQIQIQLTNRRNSIQTIFYNVEWFDADGMKITTAGGGWTQQQFMARESLYIVLTAPTINANDFIIKLMERPR
ncbi:MAG: YcfL family protein [bacterium]